MVDRREHVARAGARYRSRRGLMIGVGAEWSAADFDVSASDRSNQGIAPILELMHEGRLRQTGTEADLLARPADAFVRSFLTSHLVGGRP